MRRTSSMLAISALFALVLACGRSGDTNGTPTPGTTSSGTASTGASATPGASPSGSASPASTTEGARPTATAAPGAPAPQPSSGGAAPAPAPATQAGTPRTLTFERALGGRIFSKPTDLGSYPGARMYVADQTGTISVFGIDGTPSGTLLDIRGQVSTAGNEEGFLGVAFQPGAPYVFVYYSVAGGERRTRLARFEVQSDRAVAGSELVLFEQSQPFSNHKGGALRFGPDGMLYVGLGDGGSGGDPSNRAQNLSERLGKILRLDVRNSSSGAPYAVPGDNPFVSTQGARGEIWAYGFRNPWRFNFDAATGALWTGDVGQDKVAEIDVVSRGGNFGWRRYEGNDCYKDCGARDGLTFPVATYTHAEGGCSVTGGTVYRGRNVPALAGWYLYTDYCSGKVWAAPSQGGSAVQLLGSGGVKSVTAFGVDDAGEVYLAQQGGALLRVTGAN